MTEPDEAQLIDRDVLASALRTAAACWEGPTCPGKTPRDVAEDAVAWYVNDQPRRGSEWAGDGQPGLTPDQGRRAVRWFAVRSAPDAAQAQRAWQAVLDALEGRLAAPWHDAKLPGQVRCAQCAQPFVPRSSRHLYCAPRCKQAAHIARRNLRDRDDSTSVSGLFICT
jgi:hypothetical protein